MCGARASANCVGGFGALKPGRGANVLHAAADYHYESRGMRLTVKAPKLKTCAGCGATHRRKARRCPMCDLPASATSATPPNPRALEQGQRLARWVSKHGK